MLTKLKQLDKKQKIVIIIVLLAIMSFGLIDRFFDGDHGEGYKNFGTGKQFERSFTDGEDDDNEDGDGFNGGGIGENGRFNGNKGTKENFASSALQLGIVIAGITIFSIIIKPKDIKEVNHVILGSKRKINDEMEDNHE